MENQYFEAMHAINRPHVPDDTTAKFIYEAYLLLRSAPSTFPKWARQGAMENIAACDLSWRVVAISEKALRKIAETRTSIGLQRGHWFARDNRYEQLFGNGAPEMEREALIKFFYEHDTTVVILKEQNNANGDHTTWGRLIPVPEGLFTVKGFAFNVRVRTEIPWIEVKLDELNQERTDPAIR